MQAITLEVILQAVFGVTDPARSARLRERLPLLLGETSSLALQFRVLLSRRLGRGDPLEPARAAGEIDELLLAEIAERRADPAREQREDILSLLVAARFEDGAEMSDREVRDQLVTLLLAGHETTATALAWTFDLLLHNPATLARLTAEVDAGGEDAYLRAVIAESLRLRPVVPLAGRRLASELNVGGLSLPAGDRRDAGDLAHAHPSRISTPSRTRSAPSASSRSRRRLRLDPVRRRHPPLPGRGVRRTRDAGRARGDPAAPRAEPRERRAERVTRRNITFSRARERGCAAAARRMLPRRPSSPNPCSSLSIDDYVWRRSRSGAWPGARAPCRRRPRAGSSCAA